jgi:arylsulfatase A-like enzyme
MAHESGQPNVLFLFTDQQRPDWTGMNSDVPVRTPNLERLTDRGVHFTNAICPSPVCNPSRASIASGYEYDRCGVTANIFDYQLDRPTYYQRLRDEAGYHVMGCGKFDLQTGFSLGPTGDEGVERWGFSEAMFNPAKNNTVRRYLSDSNNEPSDPYMQYLAEEGWLEAHVRDYHNRSFETGSAGVVEKDNAMWTATFPTPLPEDVYYDEWITETGLELLRGAPTDEPWFLEVNFQNPHHPWDITESMYGVYRNPDVDFPDPVDSDLPIAAETHAEIRRNYAAMIEHLDDSVGRFLTALEKRGELENTLVVFSSDHGEMLGDYGQWEKQSPRQPSVGVPLVMAGPNVEPRDAVDHPATILDLHATFLDIAGLDPGEDIDSTSLAPFLADNGEYPREVVYSGLGPWRMMFDGRYKLVRGYDPDQARGDTREPMHVAKSTAIERQRDRDPILYDMTAEERTNLAGDQPERVQALTEQLIAIRDESRGTTYY